jgi:hypothetical protein
VKFHSSDSSERARFSWRGRLGGAFSISTQLENAGETPAAQYRTCHFRVGRIFSDASFAPKIFFCSASRFRFALLEFLLDFRRIHS